MNYPFEVIRLPQKSNIRYSVLDAKVNNVGIIFKQMASDLSEKGENAERCVVFCRRLDEDTRSLFQHLHSSFYRKDLQKF